MQISTMTIFLTLVFLAYGIYTFLFTLHFNRTNILYSPKQKLIHNLAIWLIPFIWIAILKQTMKDISGSHESRKKNMTGSNQHSSGYMEDSYSHSSFGSEGVSDSD